jgi:hypothetical protein
VKTSAISIADEILHRLIEVGLVRQSINSICIQSPSSILVSQAPERKKPEQHLSTDLADVAGPEAAADATESTGLRRVRLNTPQEPAGDYIENNDEEEEGRAASADGDDNDADFATVDSLGGSQLGLFATMGASEVQPLIDDSGNASQIAPATPISGEEEGEEDHALDTPLPASPVEVPWVVEPESSAIELQETRFTLPGSESRLPLTTLPGK